MGTIFFPDVMIYSDKKYNQKLHFCLIKKNARCKFVSLKTIYSTRHSTGHHYHSYFFLFQMHMYSRGVMVKSTINLREGVNSGKNSHFSKSVISIICLSYLLYSVWRFACWTSKQFITITV